MSGSLVVVIGTVRLPYGFQNRKSNFQLCYGFKTVKFFAYGFKTVKFFAYGFHFQNRKVFCLRFYGFQNRKITLNEPSIYIFIYLRKKIRDCLIQ